MSGVHVERQRRKWFTPTESAAKALAVIGAVWAAGFAVLHVYWAAGGRVGVTGAVLPIGSRPAFLAYDVVAALIFVLAAVIGLALARDWGSPRLRGRLLALTFVGAILALARGLVGVGQDVVGLAGGHALDGGAAYDAWFAIAGLIFVAAALGLRQSTP